MENKGSGYKSMVYLAEHSPYGRRKSAVETPGDHCDAGDGMFASHDKDVKLRHHNNYADVYWEETTPRLETPIEQGVEY